MDETAAYHCDINAESGPSDSVGEKTHVGKKPLKILIYDKDRIFESKNSWKYGSYGHCLYRLEKSFLFREKFFWKIIIFVLIITYIKLNVVCVE